MRNALLGLGGSLAGAAPALAQTTQPAAAPGQRTDLDILKGQEGGGNWREADAYAMGMQAFKYGYPLICMANLMWKWSNDPTSASTMPPAG